MDGSTHSGEGVSKARGAEDPPPRDATRLAIALVMVEQWKGRRLPLVLFSFTLLSSGTDDSTRGHKPFGPC